MEKPAKTPKNPCFSSGPCAKRPGWNIEAIERACLGRSHRAGISKTQLKDVIETHRAILGIPADYKIGIVAASDTGAVEMALWSLLGPKPVDVFAWESFSRDWLVDVTKELKIKDAIAYDAKFGELPDLSKARKNADIVFAWNGTTSGVRVPDGDWIADDREGLTICDATSAVFAYDMPWKKLDVTTWSWQKVLGGEAAHGMIVLSPRAVQRLESYTPPWPMPKTFRMLKKGKLNDGIFTGETINTPSMLAVADVLDSLKWVQSIGGLSATMKRCEENSNVVNQWIEKSAFVDFLAKDAKTRSRTSVCMKFNEPWFTALDEESQQAFVKDVTKALEGEKAAYDAGSYRDAPAGLRIWCGSTVEADDIRAMLPWVEWAYESAKAQRAKKAA
ncbi:MAG TPA: phosphoserine transaminase [Alphaproteobacteria bacterium]|nr:phosphoserine transaminase [Micavibrio sp.]MBK9562427.1 phosphoserine transaminase [Micavibrio sp.]HQX26780.1 phosphoserine transaminase [Alphaproteobacteria bacterium]